jgi:hypothetical protein
MPGAGRVARDRAAEGGGAGLVCRSLALALPFLAMALSGLVAWLLSLLTARVRNKSLMTTVFSLVFLGAYFLRRERS